MSRALPGIAGRLCLSGRSPPAGKGDLTDRRPGAVAVEAVHRDGDHLGVVLFELIQLCLVNAELIAAGRTPIQRVEHQHHVLAEEIGKRD